MSKNNPKTELNPQSYLAVAYAVTRGSDFAFFFVSFNASLRAVPSGISDI